MQHTTHCHVEPIEGGASEAQRRSARVTHLGLAGMGCPNCAHRIRNALLRTPGVVDAEIDLQASLATVWHRPAEADTSDLVVAVANAARGTNHTYLAVPVRLPVETTRGNA